MAACPSSTPAEADALRWFYRRQVEPALRGACAHAPAGTFERLVEDVGRKLSRRLQRQLWEGMVNQESPVP